jgi:hypothetical protein
MTGSIKNNYQRVAEYIMNNHHECQCNCPTKEMHYDLMFMQIEEQKYYLTEWDLIDYNFI